MPSHIHTHGCGHMTEWDTEIDSRLYDTDTEYEGQTVSDEDCQDCQLDSVPLVGSEKQVAWARRIRPKLMHDMGIFGRRLTWDAARLLNEINTPATPEMLEEMRHNIAALLDDASSQTGAAWWIDHRDSGNQMVRDAIKTGPLMASAQSQFKEARDTPELNAKRESFARYGRY